MTMACLLREPNGTNTEREEYSQAVVQMQTMNVHLRIGQYPESYERTRLPDEELDVKPEDIFVDGPVHNAVIIPSPTVLSTPAHAYLPTITSDDYGEDGPQQQAQPLPMAVLPSWVFIHKGDHRTRLRYAADVLTINGEPYIKINDHHFLYATYPDFLQTGANVTIHQVPYRAWQSDRRCGRPQILFELYPLGQWEYTPENGRRKKSPNEFRPEIDLYGRVLLNAEDHPLKYSNAMPIKVSTEIDGWEMEAICRLDPDICHQDFIDRMLPFPGGGKVRPSKGTLNHRRRRDRIRMRVLPWPLPRSLSYSDTQVVKEVDSWGLRYNSTEKLRDLSKEEIDMQCAIMYGGHLERSGANAQNDEARLQTFRMNLTLVRTKYAEDSEEVRMVKNRIGQQLEKMGLEYDHRVWDAVATETGN